MISFECDYAEGAHKKILEALTKTNEEQLKAYGFDRYSESAKNKIREYFDIPEAEICFLVGGTQTNQVVIDSLTKSFEGVIAAQTGHVAVHEAGAIEYAGHKVITLPEHMGKLDAGEVRAYLEAFYADGTFEHMAIPGIVYISHPTEYGALYTKEELEALHNVCRDYDIPLYVDGARLGYGLNAMKTDVTAKDIARLAHVFYVGGTKVGALCGEAVVFSGIKAPKHFFTHIKQHGALLAKGRLTGVQFDTLFTDGLYDEVSRHAIEQAKKLIAIVKKHGYRFFMDSYTNQQFIIIDNEKLKRLSERVVSSYWEKYDENTAVIRLATSWCTSDEMLDELDRAFYEIEK